jgi:hypothetical protein
MDINWADHRTNSREEKGLTLNQSRFLPERGTHYGTVLARFSSQCSSIRMLSSDASNFGRIADAYKRDRLSGYTDV